jgi:putative CocE/NonD family hydrolase
MNIAIVKNVQIPMRDGVQLCADVYSDPAADTSRAARPTVLLRAPYDKQMVVTTSEVVRYLAAGYVVVAQDTRGRFASEGEFRPFSDERADGEDTLRWIAEQEFSDGTVAMAGSSYFGATQWLAAAGDSPALKAMAPNITSSSFYEGWTYQGGAFELGFILCWTLGVLALGGVGRSIAAGDCDPRVFGELVAELDSIEHAYRRTPLTDVGVLEGLAPYYREWLAHPTDDDFWRSNAPRERYEAIEVPTLNIGGWYDCFLGGTLANYIGLKKAGGSELARSPRLVIGPWSHGMSLGEFPTGSFGLLANSMVADLTGRQIRFFDRHVRGIDNGLDQQLPVSIFVMGANVWRDEADWPLPDTEFTSFYLHSDGGANTASGDGRLSVDPPEEERADVLRYDPRDPVPTVGGQTFLPGFVLAANAGPRDRSQIEDRTDVLCFTTAVLTADTEVTGPVSLVLFVESDVVDTDFTGALVDVHPDGRAVILTEGILRARYRSSVQQAELMVAGQTYELSIDLWATSNVFKAGHRVRLEVSGGSFPRFDRNPNNGTVIADAIESEYLVATSRIRHDRRHPSRLVLPLIQRA